MVKRIFTKNEWKEVEEAFVRDGITYYYLRVDKQDLNEEIISCIEDIYDHIPTDEDKSTLYASYLTICKKVAKVDTIQYANSDIVKSYLINDTSGWEDSEARISIRRAATDKKATGINTYTLYHGGIGFTMTPTKVDEILASVEVYASDCYDVTEQKKIEIDTLTTIQEAETYDVTSGYPTKPSFNI